MLVIPDLDGRFLHALNRFWIGHVDAFGLDASYTAVLGTSLAHQYSRSSPSFREWSFVSTNPELNGRFLHDCLADSESVTWTSLGSMLATCQYKVHLWHIKLMKLRSSLRGGS